MTEQLRPPKDLDDTVSKMTAQLARFNEILASHLGQTDPHGLWTPYQPLPPKSKLQALLKALQNCELTYLDGFYKALYTSDVYAMLGRYSEACDSLPEPPVNRQTTMLAERRLNLKMLCGKRCDAYDVLTLFPKKLTKFGRENLPLVQTYLDLRLRAWEEDHSASLLEHFAKLRPQYPRWPPTYFNGSRFNMFQQKEPTCNFSLIPEFEALVQDLTREAENAVREEQNLPRVGEGWVSETQLYHEIRDWLQPRDVVQHATPDWLGKLHLDIFVPSLLLAVEYQGKQHDEPVSYFGGEDAFREVQQRDKRKLRLCRQHHVTLVYVREGYILDDVKEQIRGLVPQT